MFSSVLLFGSLSIVSSIKCCGISISSGVTYLSFFIGSEALPLVVLGSSKR